MFEAICTNVLSCVVPRLGITDQYYRYSSLFFFFPDALSKIISTYTGIYHCHHEKTSVLCMQWYISKNPTGGSHTSKCRMNNSQIPSSDYGCPSLHPDMTTTLEEQLSDLFTKL